MYPDQGYPAQGYPVQGAQPPAPIPGMPAPGQFPGMPAPGQFPAAPPVFAPPAASSDKRRPRNWHLALGGAMLLGVVGSIISLPGVLGFAWTLLTLAALAGAGYFGLKRGEEYRQQRQNIDVARGFAAAVPPGQEAAVPTESLVLVANSATAAATRVYGDRIYLFGKPPAEAEADAASLLAIANRAKAELNRRGAAPVAPAAPVNPYIPAAPAAPYIPGAPAAPAPPAPAPDAGVTEFILKHNDEDTW